MPDDCNLLIPDILARSICIFFDLDCGLIQADARSPKAEARSPALN
jgi:hypothetical protein